jgi:hypothetical protein
MSPNERLSILRCRGTRSSLEDAMSTQRYVVFGLAIALLVALSLAAVMYTRAEAGCYQYGSWEEAQQAHQSAPWLGLDADGNGVACDCLRQGFPC